MIHLEAIPDDSISPLKGSSRIHSPSLQVIPHSPNNENKHNHSKRGKEFHAADDDDEDDDDDDDVENRRNDVEDDDDDEGNDQIKSASFKDGNRKRKKIGWNNHKLNE